MKKLLPIVAVLLFVGCSTSHHKIKTPKIGTSMQNPKSINTLASNEQRFFINYINQVRAKGAVCSPATTPLNYNSFLEKAAFEHSKDMALNSKLTHNGSGTNSDIARKMPGVGSNFFERILFFGYPAKTYDLVGEDITHIKNIKDKRESFKKAIEMFLSEPIHCKILMKPRFKDVGVGYYTTKDGYYWTVDFGETK